MVAARLRLRIAVVGHRRNKRERLARLHARFADIRPQHNQVRRALGAGVPGGQKEEGREDEDSSPPPVMELGRVLGGGEDGPQDRRQDGEKDKKGPTAR